MNFFERLRKETMRKVEQLHIPASLDSLQAVQVTIETLKEMMVGEIMRGQIQHTKWAGGGITYIRSDKDFALMDFDGIHGTDGDGVAIAVFKNDEEE